MYEDKICTTCTITRITFVQITHIKIYILGLEIATVISRNIIGDQLQN